MPSSRLEVKQVITIFSDNTNHDTYKKSQYVYLMNGKNLNILCL